MKGNRKVRYFSRKVLASIVFYRHDISNTSNQSNIDKLEFFKIKSFCTPKDTIKKVKRQATEWENIFVNFVRL